MSTASPFYSIGLLNDIHNVFPEILYDSRLFPNDSFGPLSWLRYRIMHMFPQTFRRGRLNYEALTQQNTRADYEEWLFITGRQLQTPQQIRMPSFRNDVYSGQASNPIFTNPVLATPPTIRRTWGGEDALGILSLALNIPTETWLASFMDAVPVVPTPQEIESASEIIQNAAVPGDTMCTICQEHETSPDEGVWRKLNGCSHYFHRTCIDRWFSRNSHCPVCRFDIRERREQDQHSIQSSMESETENFQS